MLRVISGKYKGRRLEQGDLKVIRPTTDRVKEALFSIIQTKVDGAIVLDLFAGSGALAIEAVSRGATKVLANDLSAEAQKIMRQNLAQLQINNVALFRHDALQFLKSKVGTEYDLIFIDPPYRDFEIINKALILIANEKMLKAYGWIIVETNQAQDLKIPAPLVIQKKHQYGQITILILANI